MAAPPLDSERKSVSQTAPSHCRPHFSGSWQSDPRYSIRIRADRLHRFCQPLPPTVSRWGKAGRYLPRWSRCSDSRSAASAVTSVCSPSACLYSFVSGSWKACARRSLRGRPVADIVDVGYRRPVVPGSDRQPDRSSSARFSSVRVFSGTRPRAETSISSGSPTRQCRHPCRRSGSRVRRRDYLGPSTDNRSRIVISDCSILTASAISLVEAGPSCSR